MFHFGSKCKRIRRLISDSLDEPLSARAEARVRKHLATCDECRRELVFYNDVKGAAADLETRTPPAYLWERISIETDEHPWGDEPEGKTGFHKKFLPGWGKFKDSNPSGALVSFLLIAFLCLFPGLDAIDSDSSPSTTALAHECDKDLGYLSLYMMTNSDMFPDQIQEYYLTQLRAIDGKIRMIKTALDRFPENKRVRTQLAIAYSHKLALYHRIGVTEDHHPDIMDKGHNYSRKGDIYD